MTRALAGEEVSLRLVSTSLLTPTSVAGKEKAMLRDQMAAWQTLSDPLNKMNRPGFIGADSFKVSNLTAELGFYN